MVRLQPSSRRSGSWIAAFAGGAAVAAIFVMERRRPLRRPTAAVAPRILRNAVMGALCAAVIEAAEMPVARQIARRNSAERRGLAALLPKSVGPIAAFLAMDYTFYLWHIATHRVPLLWRLHRVHHVDPDLDMSTAIRFHFVEMLISLPWRALQVRLSGIGPAGLSFWQRFFTLSILFHHANLRLPGPWDRRLSRVLTTPAMHGIHHSRTQSERDSNWSSGLSIWDRLHGTLRQEDQQPRAIGVDDRRAAGDIGLAPALIAPFRAPPPKADCG